MTEQAKNFNPECMPIFDQEGYCYNCEHCENTNCECWAEYNKDLGLTA